jgi:hypothetical protein
MARTPVAMSMSCTRTTAPAATTGGRGEACANEEAPVPAGSESGQPPAFGAKGDALAGMRRPRQVCGQKSHY